MTARLKKFCLIATARTGSNYVRGLLRFPGSVFHGELFNRERQVPRIKPIPDPGLTLDDRDRDPIGFLETIERLTLEHARVCGFKLMIQHHPPMLEYVLSSEDYGLIVLSRRNKLAQYSSRAIARASGVWHVQRGEPQPLERKIRFDSPTFAAFLFENKGDYASVLPRLEGSPHRFHALEYTRIRSTESVEGLLRFVGVRPRCTIPEMIARNASQQQNTSRIVDRFSNPEEVVAAMRAMGHEDWLTEETP